MEAAMMTKTGLLTLLLSAAVCDAQAALYDRGHGLIYDDVLNVTWLQDANYAVTSGYAAAHVTGGMNSVDSVLIDGRMGWQAAKAWVDQLVYMGYDNWRLPSVGENPVSGYNMTSGELGYMYYVNLGNHSDNYGSCAPYCLTNTSFLDHTNNVTLDFLNVQSYVYWYADALDYDYVWGTHLGYGNQDSFYHAYWNYYVWAVADGDIAAVPVPAAAWLFGGGLIGLGGIARRKRRAAPV